MDAPEACEMPAGNGTKDICGAPCSIGWEWADVSSGGISPGARINCAAGHWWTLYGEEIRDPFDE